MVIFLFNQVIGMSMNMLKDKQKSQHSDQPYHTSHPKKTAETL